MLDLSSFLEDINGDKCAKLLMGMVSTTSLIILCVVSLVYALDHFISSPGVIDSVLFTLGGLSCTLLGLSFFQKPRDEAGKDKDQ